jgi:hypothetical protein
MNEEKVTQRIMEIVDIIQTNDKKLIYLLKASGQ